MNVGTLTVGEVQGGNGASTFHFNGGTLQPAASNTTFFAGLTTADVQGRGANVDTQGFDVTMAQNLVSGTSGGAVDGGLMKLGSGVLTLSGTNTYTGPTQVNAGTLAVTGQFSGTGLLTVASQSTLAGTGSIAGAVTIQGGGTLSAGLNETGTLTLRDSVVFVSTATASFTLGGTAAGSGYTQVVLGSQLNLNGATLRLNEKANLTLAPGQIFYVFDNPGALQPQGHFGNAPGGIYTDAAGDTFLVNYTANDPADNSILANDVSVTVLTVGPEPASWILIGLGGVGLSCLVQSRRTARA